MPEIKRINAWSSPRNISTAFMYAFAQRPDASVVDEPLYAHYLTQTDSIVLHPGKEDILASQENDGNQVIKNVLFADYPTPLVLFKQMTHHLIAIDWDFLLDMENILLIRHPRAIIASYSKVIPNPSIKDIGIAQQYELYNWLVDNHKPPVVIDAQCLLLNPPRVLQQLCQALDISFEEAMLSWSPGSRPEDGVWAKYWYASVHQSTGFQPYIPQEYALSPELEKLAEACLPYYQQLYQASIKG
ncbi:MAG TPA: hypothetical protein PKA00_05765 [Saprospiraceae bacterium]|nr:hypothetical protein [Saprospiraceae bacterium]HMQ82389.1 hypothetical protein [Saprospiraceae bacterium]